MVPLCPCVPLRARVCGDRERGAAMASRRVRGLIVIRRDQYDVRETACLRQFRVRLPLRLRGLEMSDGAERQTERGVLRHRAGVRPEQRHHLGVGRRGRGWGGMGGGGRPWSQNTQDSGRGGGNGGGRHQSNQYGNQNNDRYCSSGYQNSDRDRPRFSSSGSGGGGGGGNDDDFYTKTQSEQRFRGDGGGGGRTRPGQYRVKVQYGSGQGGGPDSRAYPLGRKRRATKIISNNAKNATGRNPTSSETGKTSLLEELDACVVQCIFRQMEMLTEDARPDKNSVISVMTQRIRDPELKEFIQESIEECFDIIESDAEGGKCEYSKNFAMCLEEKGRRNCEDWEEAAQINRFKGIQSGMSPPDTTNNYNPPNFNNFNSNNQGNRPNAFYNYNGK
nr:PREDICTED: uncharacterized protein LOC109038604 [Bemisia tabaci]